MNSLTVDELIIKLQEISKQGRGDLYITIPAEDNKERPSRSLVGIENVSWGDQGGWGSEIAIMSPNYELKLKKDK